VQPSDQPAHLPDAPGVYRFEDAAGQLLYVGKAKSLSARLPAYFAPPASLHPRTRQMVAAAARVTWLVLPSELDALLTEHRLISTHQPRFNVRLKNDDAYPYLALTREPIPRLVLARRASPSLELFGPYPQARGLRTTAELLASSLGVANCTASTYASSAKTATPCLRYSLGQCSAPCAGHIGPSDYAARVDTLRATLRGSSDQLVAELTDQMHEAAAELDFERAARRRDQVTDVARLAEQSLVDPARRLDADVLALSPSTSTTVLARVKVRHGSIVGFASYSLDELLDVDTAKSTAAELLATAITQLYADATEVPPALLVATLPSDKDLLESMLGSRAGRRVRISAPSRGLRAELVATAQDNARAAAQRASLSRATDIDARTATLNELAALIGLDHAPLRMECYDMAHLQGTAYVGSMVVFTDGLARRGHYRTFKLRKVPGNNDLAAMKEVLTRRLAKLASSTSDPSFSVRPDLLVIDGGPAQLAIVHEVLVTLGLAEVIPVVALAKRLEELYVPDHPEPIAPTGEVRYLLQRLRDEAHRVANTTHARLRAKSMTASSLAAVKGLGPARRARLLEHFGSLSALTLADRDELRALGWLPTPVADNLFTMLHPDGEPESSV
jgi:excinuclease ABC subunit C